MFILLPQAFNHAILHLADGPAIVQAIREQTEKIVDEEGWTKVSLSKMTTQTSQTAAWCMCVEIKASKIAVGRQV